MLEGLSSALNKEPRVVFGPSRLLDVPTNVLDISAAREHLKWSPRVGFDEGIRRTVKGFL